MWQSAQWRDLCTEITEVKLSALCKLTSVISVDKINNIYSDSDSQVAQSAWRLLMTTLICWGV